MRSLRQDVGIHAGSMADIAFLLLLFFLVATSIEPDKGIQVLLPVYSEEEAPVPLNEDRVLSIKINAANQLMIENRYVVMGDVTKEVKEHVFSELARARQPVISVLTDTSAIYDTYLTVYDQIKKAYNELRQKQSSILFKKDFIYLTKEEKREIVRRIPMIISEADYR